MHLASSVIAPSNVFCSDALSLLLRFPSRPAPTDFVFLSGTNGDNSNGGYLDTSRVTLTSLWSRMCVVVVVLTRFSNVGECITYSGEGKRRGAEEHKLQVGFWRPAFFRFSILVDRAKCKSTYAQPSTFVRFSCSGRSSMRPRSES